MSETPRPSEEEIGGIRKKYEKNMGPSFLDKIKDKIAGKKSDQKEVVMGNIMEDAKNENQQRAALKEWEDHKKSPYPGGATKEERDGFRDEAIEYAREQVEKAAKKNL